MSQLDRHLRHPNGGPSRDNRDDGTGRTPTSDPLLDRIDLEMEGSGPMGIMPAADSTEHPPPHSRIDGCPECVLNVEPPRSIAAIANGHRAAYLCSDCGHAWTTDWSE